MLHFRESASNVFRREPALSTQRVALRREVYSLNMPQQMEEFGEIGFTPKDRENLITLVANQANMERMFERSQAAMERRIERLELERAHKEDLARIERELRADLGEKANRSELSGSALEKLQTICDQLERKVTWAYAWAAGAAAATGYIVWLFLKK